MNIYYCSKTFGMGLLEAVVVSSDRGTAFKMLFWEDDEPVFQYHPPKAEWISNHARCLHMWRSHNQECPKPPSAMVGYKELGDLEKR